MCADKHVESFRSGGQKSAVWFSELKSKGLEAVTLMEALGQMYFLAVFNLLESACKS